MGRAPCCDKANVKKGPWSPEEDAKLKEYIDKNGTGGNWISLPHKAGLKRCGKSCRLRWLNYLRPNIKHGEFSDDEDKIICSLYANIGSRWSIIAAQLAGRTDNDIKNYWNTKLKKRLKGLLPNSVHGNSNYGVILRPSSPSLRSSNNSSAIQQHYQQVQVNHVFSTAATEHYSCSSSASNVAVQHHRLRQFDCDAEQLQQQEGPATATNATSCSNPNGTWTDQNTTLEEIRQLASASSGSSLLLFDDNSTEEMIMLY